MAIPINPQTIKSASMIASKGFYWYVKTTTLLIFFIYLLIHTTALAIHEKDFNVVIKDLGEELFSPLQTAQEKINDLGSANLIGSIWDYWGIFYEFYKIFLWFKIYMWITSMFSIDVPAIRIASGIIIFYLMNVIYTALVFGDPNLPFQATLDIYKGLMRIILERPFSFQILNNNSCVGKICNA